MPTFPYLLAREHSQSTGLVISPVTQKPAGSIVLGFSLGGRYSAEITPPVAPFVQGRPEALAGICYRASNK